MNTGPKLKNDNLVFGYDTGYGVADNGVETRFYKGEPTTNILPSPEKNGRFTTDNQWRSYNTNQYNSNTDFDIGTIGSVSDNIVTLSSVGHNIRSFDVLNPATSGGGVTAGTNYVVKKISSSTFSLHAYNNSQDGSQGYINPDTGFFKVHDAYANDTRVSISASGFPEMWHGAPHLPNSGLIKEIVANGGYIKGTNCMRFHIYRGDGVRDGMAYNVYTPVTQGDVITVSYWVRPVNSFAHGKTWVYQTYFGSGNSASYFTTTLNSTGEWQHVEHQWTASVTFNFYSYWFPSGSTDKWAMDMADVQVEVNKGHATPFTLTSRSNTASLIDLKKTTDIDVSNVSFDSTGQPEFDGSDDRGIVSNFPHIWDDSVSMECVIKFEDNSRSIIFGNYTVGANDVNFEKISGKLRFYWNRGERNEYSSSNSVTENGSKYHHCVFVRDISTNNFKFYIDGVLDTTSSTNAGSNLIEASMPTNHNKFRIGADTRTGTTVHNGAIPIIKVYSKALSTTEVTQNFNAYKNRFDL